jgi:uncharacterized protein YoxC
MGLRVRKRDLLVKIMGQVERVAKTLTDIPTYGAMDERLALLVKLLGQVERLASDVAYACKDVEDASKGVKDASKGVKDASKGVKDASKGVEDASGDGGPGNGRQEPKGETSG